MNYINLYINLINMRKEAANRMDFTAFYALELELRILDLKVVV